MHPRPRPCLALIAFVCLLLPTVIAQDNDHVVIFKPELTYETGEEIVEIGKPRYLDMDQEGNLYVLDVQARQIHIWDKQGKFKRSIGRKGEGPGEFNFATQVGELAIFQGKIIVVDERATKIHYFDLETGAFERTLPRPSNLARINLYPTESGKTLFALNVSGNRSIQEVLQLNLDLEIEDILYTAPDDMYEWLEDRNYIIRPYANRIILSPIGEQLLVAESQNNQIRIFDHTGSMQRTIMIPMTQDDIKEEDKQRLRRRLTQADSQNKARLEFHEKNSFFNLILPVNDMILVMKLRGESRHIAGLALNQTYQRIGSFNTSLGDLTFISSFKRRILTITVHENGEYQLMAYSAHLERRSKED